tara:strand:- start:99 stop:1022 length:924 start_codon:yes stop_codon:yes gene_type:complete
MSIHDQYFSKENKNYMFGILRNLILNETSFDIDTNQEYIDFYRFKYRTIFEKNNVESLSELNKLLIDEIGSLFINDINTKYKKDNIKIYNKINKNIEKEEIIPKNEIHINSSDRTNNSLNRYQFEILIDENISNLNLKKITIPQENNKLFINPMVCIQFKIDNKIINNYCNLKDTIITNDTKFNNYEPTAKLIIPIKENKILITILNNLKQKVLENTDIINIQKIKNIEYKNKKYLGIIINNENNENNINNNDLLGIYCNDKLLNTSYISKRINNCLLFENIKLNYDKTNKYSLLQLNLQNNFIFEY